MNPDALLQLKSQLNDKDLALFESLLQALQEVKDISQLSGEQQQQLQTLVKQYGGDSAESRAAIVADNQSRTTDFSIIESGFGEYARQLLARHLSQQFSSEEEAFVFAFDNRFVPPELQEIEVAAEIFEKFRPDIEEANQWRDDLVGTDSDPVMAVGLTWFMYIFQMAKRLKGQPAGE